MVSSRSVHAVSLASSCHLSSRLTAVLDDGVDCARQSVGGATSRTMVSQLNTAIWSATDDYSQRWIYGFWWARFRDCAHLSDRPSDDSFQLTLSVSKITYLLNE